MCLLKKLRCGRLIELLIELRSCTSLKMAVDCVDWLMVLDHG
jgi:hypothetical protein